MKKFFRSFGYAYQGVRYALSSELNLRIHCLSIIVITTLGFWFNLKPIEWVTLIAMFGLVVVAELFNTAIEQLTNLVSPDFSKKAGLVKDIAAAAVLIAAIIALLVGCIIFYPHLQTRFFTVYAS